MQLYTWVVFIHVAFVLVFVLGHGASAAVSLRLRAEQDPVRIGALLDLSRWSLGIAGIGLLGLLASGIAAGIMGGWFDRWWIWLSLAVLVAVGGLMTPMGRGYLDDVRRAVGIATGDPKREAEPPVPDPARLESLLRDRRPVTTAALGLFGLFAMLWLMYAKPF